MITRVWAVGKWKNRLHVQLPSLHLLAQDPSWEMVLPIVGISSQGKAIKATPHRSPEICPPHDSRFCQVDKNCHHGKCHNLDFINFHSVKSLHFTLNGMIAWNKLLLFCTSAPTECGLKCSRQLPKRKAVLERGDRIEIPKSHTVWDSGWDST